jgi:hypothetical protein
MRRSPVLSRISGVFDLLAAAKIQLADNFYAQELAHRGPHKNEQDPARFFWQSRDWEPSTSPLTDLQSRTSDGP